MAQSERMPSHHDTPSIERQAMYIGDPQSPIFAVWHASRNAAPRRAVAVLCPPLGYEYIHSHRSVRHLADALALSGVPALRIDYHGTGDSPGSDLDAGRLDRWLNDIRVAVAEARSLSQGAPVCLLGVRLGATLAALVEAEVDVDWLALWFPVASGRRYLREQKIFANPPAGAQPTPDAPLEAAGFLLTPATQAALNPLNLLQVPSRAPGGVLLIQREDIGADASLHDHLVAQGLNVQSVLCPGYAEMVAEPVDTQVPTEAIEATVNWLRPLTEPADAPVPAPTRPDRMRYDFAAPTGAVTLEDRVGWFGPGQSLCGIHTRPVDQQSGHAGLPTIVLLNSGVVHRVGANRFSTTLSREFAALGFAVFRFDITGIGDSVTSRVEAENDPYPDEAQRDVEAALGYLRDECGARHFVVAGLCSGGYYSFVAGFEHAGDDILEVILMNPPNLNWKEEGFLINKEFGEATYYRESMRSGNKWKKLLRGQVNLINVAKVAGNYLAQKVQSQGRAALERVLPRTGSRVANQLRKIYALKRHVTVVDSSGDAGWEIMMNSARVVINQGLKSGKLTHIAIADADHTFTSLDARERLAQALLQHLTRRYLSPR